jgi:hypothetical protein
MIDINANYLQNSRYKRDYKIFDRVDEMENKFSRERNGKKGFF